MLCVCVGVGGGGGGEGDARWEENISFHGCLGPVSFSILFYSIP